ncbi:hypothetical protein M407DRAFT_235983 [Tulasnella calospora MUT 4182]|uniref:F-box domain-containing protein n=1 Tax=Tulasnella calospora MUT 4182 TaxID=1051891 RepID=A0A0C3QKN2_9AGAM|nr:hypothetical protein M407DRAFT_235983 [Tulasnella calospora MUT 4182]
MVTTRLGALNTKSEANLNEPEQVTNEGLPAEKPGRKRRKPQRSQTDDEYSDVPAPGPSRIPDTAKTEQIVRRNGKRGRLRDMMDMPIDIFAEVCSHVDPLDLRHLARTSKRIRDILMTNGAKRIWMTVLASVAGLPECPTDLSEPRYVRLMFTNECDVPV